jgi:hypothetical protein
MISSRATFAFSQLSRHVKTGPGATLGGMSCPRSFHSPAYKRDMKRQKAQAKPTVAIAKAMSARYETMDNQTLVTIAAMKVHDARAEVLKRHIMVVDNVSYEEACVTFATIAARNRRGMALAALPYQIGVTAAVGGAFVSIPMVFDLSTAEWFNGRFVTTDVPEPKDLETFLEVGSWTWGWMEPVLGHVSFFLLCLQFSR